MAVLQKVQDLTLGSRTMIDGFEDGLIGAKEGRDKDIKS